LAAKSHKNPLIATNVQVKQSKKQKFEPRYWVITREKDKVKKILFIKIMKEKNNY